VRSYDPCPQPAYEQHERNTGNAPTAGSLSNAVAAAPLKRERFLKRLSRSRLGRIAADYLRVNEGPLTPFDVLKRPGRNSPIVSTGIT
jgi:hypothetical protein